MVDKIELFCCWFIGIFFIIVGVLGLIYGGTGIGIPIILFIVGVVIIFIPFMED